MHVQQLTLDEFRNYGRLELELEPGMAVIQGDNASGKTSLLEAVYMLATTRSPRTSSDLELINFAAPNDLGSPPFARVTAKVDRLRGVLDVEILVVRDEELEGPGGVSGAAQARKRIKVNGVARRALDLVGQVNVVLFTPQDVDLIIGPPALRRRYTDVTISQMDHRYVRLLSQYMKVLAQRNSLLKMLREQGRNPLSGDVSEELAYWDDELVRHGSYIVLRREVFAARLSARAEAVHHLLAGTEATNGRGDTRQMLLERRPTAEMRFQLTYSSEVAPESRALLMPELLTQIEEESRSGAAAEEHTAALDPALYGRIPHLDMHLKSIGDELKGQLIDARVQEVRRGVSLLGPHRDDILFKIGELPLAAYGSRGQQRTAVLALKLAEVDLMAAETGDTPILLLDDIMSELDARRRGFLLSTIASHKCQALITATDLSGFDTGFIEQASHLYVTSGEVTRS